MDNSLLKNNSHDNYDNLPNELSLRDYLIILRIHLKKILFIMILVSLYSIYGTYTVPPSYIAEATVLIREKPGASMIMSYGGNQQKNRMINEIQLIKSRALAKEVVKNLWNSKRRNNLHVFGTRVYYPKGTRARQLIKELFTFGLYDQSEYVAKKYNEPYTETIGEKFAENILLGLEVKARKNTDILEIRFTSVNADEATRIANIVAKTYVRMDKEWSSDNAVQAVEFLESLAVMQEKKLDNAELDIKNFRIQNNMYSLDGNTNSIATQIGSLESELYNILAEINIRKENIDILNSKLSKEEKNLTDQLLDNINSQLVTLRLKISELESKLIANKNLHGDSHGAIKELESQINSLKLQLNERVTALVDKGVTVQDPLAARQEIITKILSLDSEVIGLELRLAEIRKMQEIFINKLTDLPQKQLELSGMERGISVLNKNYVYVREKLEEAKLNVAISVGNAQFVDSAKRPHKPFSPNHKEDILKGIFIGLGIGVLIALLIEFLDNTVKTIDDIEKYGLGILGIIPSIGEIGSKKFKWYPNIGNKKLEKNRLNKRLKRRLITREDPKSPVSESYRSLRTSMLYSSSIGELKSVLVSSAGPGEGKTTTVANLAITYANLGKKTILVDTDLRRPVVHKVFDLDREPGITNYLSGQTDDYRNLVKSCEIENLSIITSGVIPPNPSELLGSARTTELVKNLESEWDMVLFDSPPLIAVTDATMITKEIDQIVLVVKSGQTDKKAFHHTITNLKNINAPLGGIIMNAVTGKSSYGSYYYHYYYQYYHYYGDKE